MSKLSYKYWLLRWQCHMDSKFLLQKAFQKAMSEGLEINAGTEFIFTPEEPEEPKGRIYLRPLDGGVDITELLKLIADDYPEVIDRFSNNLDEIAE